LADVDAIAFCPKCNGEGTVPDELNISENAMVDCDVCDATGEVEVVIIYGEVEVDLRPPGI